MLTPDQMQSALRKRFDLWNTGDYNGWRATIAPDATIEDPDGSASRPLGDYRQEWDAAHGEHMSVTLHVIDCFPRGNEAAAYVEIRMKLAGQDEEIVLQSIAVYTFDGEGRFLHERDYAPSEIPPALAAAFTGE